MNKIAIWIVAGLWVSLIAYLTITALGAKPDAQSHPWQRLILVVSIAVAFALPHLSIFRFVNYAPVGPVLSGTGVAVTIAGMAFVVWGRQHLGSNWSQTVSAKEGHELVISGPYQFVRHPMYTGGLAACVGSAIAAGGFFVFLAVLLAPIFLWRVHAEERLLSQQFPTQFPEYAKRTNALIPLVW